MGMAMARSRNACAKSCTTREKRWANFLDIQCIELIFAEILELPSWLTNHIPEEPTKNDPPPAKPRIDSLRTFLAGQSPNMKNKSSPRLNKKLKTCHSLEDIRRLAADFQFNMQLATACSQIAFRRLLQTTTKIRVILQFLEDPSLNNPEAQNIQTFLRWYLEQKFEHHQDVDIIAWLRRQISLGCLMGPELQTLLRTVFDLRRSLQTKFQELSFPLAISESLNISTVFQIRDISTVTLNLLLDLMSYGHLSPEMERSGLQILQSLNASQIQHMNHSISSFLRSCLLAEIFNGQRRSKCIKRVNNMSNILILLQELPKNIIISIVIPLSKKLLECRKPASVDRSISIEAFDAWCSYLINNDIFKLLEYEEGWDQFKHDLKKQNIKSVGPYLQNFSIDNKIYFTSFNPANAVPKKFCPFTAARTKECFKPLKGYRFIQHLFVTMFQISGTRVSPSSDFSSLLQVVDKLGMDRTTLALIHCFRERWIKIDHQVIINQIRKHADTFPHIAYYLFKQTPNLPLESCPAVAEIMIYNARFNPGTALSHRCQRQPGLVHVLGNQIEGEEEVRQARIELFGRMAIAYANATHLFPRVALRQVYSCYLLHRQYKLSPLSVRISRALTISGIVRPLQESRWVCTDRLAWILKIVGEVEGEAVAARVDELVYGWRSLIHREMERKRMVVWHQEALGIFDTDMEVPKRETQRKFFRGPASRGWVVWEKTNESLRRILWGLNMAKTNADNSVPVISSASPTASATDTSELSEALSSDIVLQREMERYRARIRR